MVVFRPVGPVLIAQANGLGVFLFVSSIAMMHKIANTYIAYNATVVGNVKLSNNVNIWFASVVRGDVAPIILCDNVNLQDGVIVHCDYDVEQILEPNVVVGHAAVVHGVRVGEGTLIGIGARTLGGSIIGAESIIAAGCVVPPGMVVPARSVVMGVPGRVVRSARSEEIEHTRTINKRYRELAQRYVDGEFPNHQQHRTTPGGD